MQNWIEDLSLKRRSQRSNVFLLETFDFKRLAQIKEVVAATNGELKKLFKASYDQIIDYNLQRNKLINLRTKSSFKLDPMKNPLVEIDNFLLTARTVAIIDYVFTSEHANALIDYLAAWSQDTTLFSHKSTVMVFTSDTNLFPETIRRLCYPISIVPSTSEERRVFISKLAETIKTKFAEKYGDEIAFTAPEELIQASAGLDLHSIETACFESFQQERKFNISSFTDYKKKILKTYGLAYVEPTIGFERIGGFELLKNYMRNRVIYPLQHPEKAEYYGVGLPRGIILFGTPGTGKSLFSEAIAKELGLPMIKLSPSDLLRGVVGESERRVRQITMLIESLAPVLVFIDEKLIDKYAAN